MSIVGKRFGCRKRLSFGEPLQPVEVIKEGPPRVQKVRVRYLDGEWEGLEEWIPKQRLLVPWEEAEAFLDDERKMLAAVDAAGDADFVVKHAVGTVFGVVSDIYGKGYLLTAWRAVEDNLILIREFEAAVDRLRLDKVGLLSEPHAFVDREGTYKAPLVVGEKLAKEFCRRFPRRILVALREEEDSWHRKAFEEHPLFGEQTTMAEIMLEKYRPVRDLVREWCGQDAIEEYDEVTALRQEIHRLRRLIESTGEWLRRAGHPVKAAALLKEIGIESTKPGRLRGRAGP